MLLIIGRTPNMSNPVMNVLLKCSWNNYSVYCSYIVITTFLDLFVCASFFQNQSKYLPVTIISCSEIDKFREIRHKHSHQRNRMDTMTTFYKGNY